MFTNFFILQVGSSEIIYKLNRACQIKLLLNRRVKTATTKYLQQRVLHKKQGSYFSSDDTLSGQS